MSDIDARTLAYEVAAEAKPPQVNPLQMKTSSIAAAAPQGDAHI
jgi:hypothetical protein